MIVKTRNPAAINRIINDPAVHDAVAVGLGHLDSERVVTNPHNATFVGEHGCIMFVQISKDVYEVHAAVLPAGWGDWTNIAGHEAVRRMFEEYGAAALIFPCPADNPRASWGARMLGAEPRWRGKGRGGIELVAYGLTREMWEARTCQ